MPKGLQVDHRGGKHLAVIVVGPPAKPDGRVYIVEKQWEWFYMMSGNLEVRRALAVPGLLWKGPRSLIVSFPYVFGCTRGSSLPLQFILYFHSDRSLDTSCTISRNIIGFKRKKIRRAIVA